MLMRLIYLIPTLTLLEVSYIRHSHPEAMFYYLPSLYLLPFFLPLSNVKSLSNLAINTGSGAGASSAAGAGGANTAAAGQGQGSGQGATAASSNASNFNSSNLGQVRTT
jgi:hypothetical protein